MKQIKLLLALAWAVSMDTAWGLLVTHIASRILGVPLEWWEYAIGLVFAHLPDVDAILEQIIRGRITGAHKKDSFSHYPLLMIPLIGLAVGSFSTFWGPVAAIILILHYVEDTVVLGPGICWLWPFDKRSFWFLRRRGGKWMVATALTEAELREQHELSLEQWLRRNFFVVKPQGVANLLLLASAILVVLLWR